MARSVQIRVDNDYAKMLKKMQVNYSRQLGKPVTIVQVTRILKDEPNKNIVFYKKRGKKVHI